MLSMRVAMTVKKRKDDLSKITEKELQFFRYVSQQIHRLRRMEHGHKANPPMFSQAASKLDGNLKNILRL